MNSRQLLACALDELEAWPHDGSRHVELDFYRSVEHALRSMRQIEDLGELHLRVAALTRMIADSGPLSAQFIPSFHELAIALDKLRARGRTAP